MKKNKQADQQCQYLKITTCPAEYGLLFYVF